MTDFWGDQARPGPDSVVVADVTIARGALVRLRPKAGGDVFDLALADRLAAVESIEQDSEGKLHVTVTLEDDPGRDLGAMRALGHRFFFGIDEIEPVAEAPAAAKRPAILVACIGNLFLGDDGFGVEVARRLADVPLPDGVELRDFGIRGMDLAYALQESYETVVFVDAAQRGERPGTVSLVEPDLGDAGEAVLETHAMDPLRVIALARAMGHVPPRVLLVACEPETVVGGEHDEDLVGTLSAPVAAAVDEAVGLVRTLITELAAESESERKVVAE